MPDIPTPQHSKSLDRRAMFMWIVVGFWLVAQIAVAIYYQSVGAEIIGDAASYVTAANRCAESHQLYPQSISGIQYIFNPGFINMLALVVSVFGTTQAMAYVNIVLNALMLYAGYRIAKYAAGTAVGQWFVIIFCLLPSNTFSVLAPMSDLPAVSLCLCSVAMLSKNRKTLIVSGIIITLANYVRPIGVIYFIPSIIFLLLQNKDRFIKTACYLGGIAAGIVILATISYLGCNGRIILGSTTAGVNMLMGADDDATGTFQPNDRLTVDDSLDAYEIDHIYKERALNWMKENPGKMLMLAPKKLYYQFYGDHYIMHNILSDKISMPDTAKDVALWSIPYYLMLLLACRGLWLNRNKLFGIYGLIVLTIIGNAAMAVLTVGAPRYHFPAIAGLVFLAATGISTQHARIPVPAK